jgi:hypothetical protein
MPWLSSWHTGKNTIEVGAARDAGMKAGVVFIGCAEQAVVLASHSQAKQSLLVL